MPQLTKQELTLLKHSILQEKSLIGIFEMAAKETNDPNLRGKWHEAAATHETHLKKLQSFLEG